MEELLDSLARTRTEVFKVLRLHPNSNLDDFMPVANEFNSFSIEEDPLSVMYIVYLRLRNDVNVTFRSRIIRRKNCFHLA